MKKINFALISDVIFFMLCAFFISFAAIRYFFKSAITALIISLGITAVAGVISFVLLLSKRKKLMVFTLGENEKKSLALHLSVCNEKAVKSMFLAALDGTYAAGNRLEDDEHTYYFNFKLSKISPDDIAAVIKDESEKAKRLFCCSASPEALSLAEDFSITVTAIAEIYLMLKEKNLLPEKYALGEVKKPSVFKRIKKRFNRKICPSLFFSGLTLLAFSFFTFYPVYYIVSGAVLMSLSAVVLMIAQPS